MEKLRRFIKVSLTYVVVMILVNALLDQEPITLPSVDACLTLFVTAFLFAGFDALVPFVRTKKPNA